MSVRFGRVRKSRIRGVLGGKKLRVELTSLTIRGDVSVKECVTLKDATFSALGKSESERFSRERMLHKSSTVISKGDYSMLSRDK